MTTNHGAEVLHIFAFRTSAEWIDKSSDIGKEFGMEFVDRCKGIPDPPEGGEHFGEVLLYGEYLSSPRFS